MDSGFYTSAVGMLDGYNVESNVSDNLANLQTPGYKERTPVLDSFTRVLLNSQETQGVQPTEVAAPIGRLGLAPQITSYGLNLAQGNPRYTGNPLDVMIVGDGFFRVRAGNQTLLTRNGSLHRSAKGELLTTEGYPVLGATGRPITVPPGTLTARQDGSLWVDGKLMGRIALARVPVGKPLTEAGNGYYVGPGQTVRAGQASVLQGYVEGSNVDMSTQMSSMMSAQRAYQANSRMLQMQDDTMSLAVNDLGKVSS